MNGSAEIPCCTHPIVLKGDDQVLRPEEGPMPERRAGRWGRAAVARAEDRRLARRVQRSALLDERVGGTTVLPTGPLHAPAADLPSVDCCGPAFVARAARPASSRSATVAVVGLDLWAHRSSPSRVIDVDSSGAASS